MGDGVPALLFFLFGPLIVTVGLEVGDELDDKLGEEEGKSVVTSVGELVSSIDSS